MNNDNSRLEKHLSMPGEDPDFHTVFERADNLMYKEKKLLKNLGAVTRDEEEEKAPEEPVVLEELMEAPVIHVRRHILIVEDEEINQIMLGNILAEDYEILYAADGIEAWATMQEHKKELALVLLDLMMPRMNGTELLEMIKQDAEMKLIPVIVLTADQRSEVECLKLGAMDFIPKPYPSPEIIKARVNKCIELSENRNIIQSTERDSLTKLFNIDYFIRYVRMFDQNYPDQDMDAVIVDVNRFHMINERYGKSYGDTVLRQLGERIRQTARKLGGVGCRRGADTFLIYAPHIEDYEEILEKLSDALEKNEDQAGRIRLRMGVYYKADKELDAERRFDRAKIAADSVRGNYAKSIGIYDSELHESALFRERLIEDFESNLEGGNFGVFFQPKYDIRSKDPVLSSAEALVRWKHPELGMISPGVFIPLLEDNGMIFSLDRFVWEETARRLREWKDRYGFSVPVSVNVSRIDMLMPNLKEIFTGILEKYQLTTKDIILEITESAYTGDSEQVISMVKELRGMGFRIEMDDFGTGYSSLGMLSNLPIDVLKLDMSFVRSAFGEKKDMRMIELIIDIAGYLSVPVVAEGVETREQYLALKAMGCDLIQGYYFSKPVPYEEFEPMLAERGPKQEEVRAVTERNYLSISKTLAGGFEAVFYVDTETGDYLEFHLGENGELQINTEGKDFYGGKYAGQETESLKTKNQDDHHAVLGIRREP